MASRKLSTAKQSTIDTSNGNLRAQTQSALNTQPSANGTKGKLKSTRKTQPVSPSASSRAVQPSPSSSQHSQSASATKTNGNIQSFFARGSSQKPIDIERRSRASQSRAVTPDEAIETIDSDEDTASPLALSKGSSTALTVRKRKLQLHDHATNGSGHGLGLSASQKFRKLDDDGRATSSATTRNDERPWTDRFAPTTLDELAVHKRKVDDVRQWLETAFRARRNKALIVKGPAGAGKTSTVRLVAGSMGLEVVEWTPPASRDLSDASQSYSSQFEDFLLRSGKSSGLVFTTDGQPTGDAKPVETRDESRSAEKHFLLIEDFPNTYSTASSAVQSFRSAIARHLASQSDSPIPLIFVISETTLSTNTAAADSFTTHRLLGPELGIHPYIDTIEFNPIAPTFLLKALDLIVVKEARKSGRRTTPGKAVLKRLSEFGDIRSAVSTLEFLCLRGDTSELWSAKVAFTKPKKKTEPLLTKTEEEALKWISNRANSLNIFHAVGKVVYNKRVPLPQHSTIEELPEWLAHHKRQQIPENDANDLVTEIGTETTTFIAALHENYLLSCSNPDAEAALDSVCGSIDNLSDSDLLCLDRYAPGSRYGSGSATDSLRQDEIAFQLGVRGVQFSLPANVKRSAPSSGTDRRDAFRMFYPASMKLWKMQAETNEALERVSLSLRTLRLRTPKQPENVMRTHLYTTTGVTPHAQDSDESTTSSLLQISKSAMLIECLSFVYSVLQVRNPGHAVLQSLRAVIKLAGFADNGQDGEDAEPDGAVGAVEQWATDKSDDLPPSTKQRLAPGKDQGRAGSAPRAKLPVDKDIASLVLEDDDIVDD